LDDGATLEKFPSLFQSLFLKMKKELLDVGCWMFDIGWWMLDRYFGKVSFTFPKLVLMIKKMLDVGCWIGTLEKFLSLFQSLFLKMKKEMLDVRC